MNDGDPLDNPLVQAQSDHISELLALLRDIQWSSQNKTAQMSCPCCNHSFAFGHASNCRLHEAIKEYP